MAEVGPPRRLPAAALLGLRRIGAGGREQNRPRIVGTVAHVVAHVVARAAAWVHGQDPVRSPLSTAVEERERESKFAEEDHL